MVEPQPATTELLWRPILFSGPMVRAILDGTKSQTRRVVTPQPPDGLGRLLGPEWYTPAVENRQGELVDGKPIFGVYNSDGDWGCKCPWQPGDRLWVRETWAVHGPLYDDLPARKIHYSVGGCWEKQDSIWYRATNQHRPATGKCSPHQRGRWRPSIFMPRWASRITLEVTGVRIERVQEISPFDALAEGIQLPRRLVRRSPTAPHDTDTHTAVPANPIPEFRALWDSINAKRGYGWDVNPRVWCISFRRGQKLEKQDG